ncbi:MAG: metallophosphoesterase [Candidatus Levybacteria bacterium]|nr:metallophosphoesterase [Candidatus Levybacteria bacterium]
MNKTRIAAIGDIHMNKEVAGTFRKLFDEISQKAQVLVISGDLTAHGHEEEAKILARELSYCKIPVVGVLGNHDYENGRQEEIRKILSATGMFILEEEPHVINKIGFVGTKGFGGGFDNHMLGMFGEKAIKQFVQESISETLKLENALLKLTTEKKIVVLHYSPIRQTVEGEAREIYPFLGSSRLVEPIDNFNVTAVFHGHAHSGTLEGKTLKGIPVYNVALPLRKRLNKKQPYVLIEV